MRRHVKVLAACWRSACWGPRAATTMTTTTRQRATPRPAAADVPDGPAISIGAQDFGESAILAEIYEAGARRRRLRGRIQELGGFRDLLFGAFESGDVNLAPDYVASELEFLNDRPARRPATSTRRSRCSSPARGVELVAPDAVRGRRHQRVRGHQETSDELGITTLSDLAEKGPT